VPIWSASGWWSNVDIYLQAPDSWDDIRLRLFSLTGGTRHLVAETTVGSSGMEEVGGPGGNWRGIVLSGRGHPGSGWAVEALNDSLDTSQPSAKIAGELWGTESTPDGIGSRPAGVLHIPDKAMPSRASHLMGWPVGLIPPTIDPFYGPWLPIACNPLNGHLIVDAAIVVPPLVVAEASLFTNLATAVSAVVKATPGRVFSAAINNTVGATRFFQLFNAIVLPAPAAVPFISIRIPANSEAIIGTDFFGARLEGTPLRGGLNFSTGIAWGWSTTDFAFTAGLANTQGTHITFA
jgi:hypothetical protein